jgi:hypothetical protein
VVAIKYEIMSRNGYGNVYEIRLSNGKYVYVCWIREFNFGIFNYISEEPTDLDNLLFAGFKAYKACKEKAVKKKIWKLIGHIDLEKENIQVPDLASFMPHNKEFFIKESRVMRNGNSIKVPASEYLSLLKKGYIYGFFDDYIKFEQWLSNNIDGYPENQNIFPLPDL